MTGRNRMDLEFKGQRCQHVRDCHLSRKLMGPWPSEGDARRGWGWAAPGLTRVQVREFTVAPSGRCSRIDQAASTHLSPLQAVARQPSPF